MPSMEYECSHSMDMELQARRNLKETKETKSPILPSFLKFFKKIFGRNEVFPADEGDDERLLWLRGDFCFEDDEDGCSLV